MEFTIRKATLEDIIEILELDNAEFKGDCMADYNHIEGIIEKLDYNYVAINSANNDIIGYVLTNIINEEDEPCEEMIKYMKDNKITSYLVIDGIVVKKEYRDKKVGTKLLDKLVTELKETYKSLFLQVRKSNDIAIHLYKKIGFDEKITLEKYYPDENEDAILMIKNL